MRLKNTPTHFGTLSISLHWIMALLILCMLTVGLIMTNIPGSPTRSSLVAGHKATGLIVLALAILRTLWRLAEITPLYPDTMSQWQKVAARLSHFFLYCLMLAMPLSGWIMSSAAGHPVSFFGLFTMPDLVGPDLQVKAIAKAAHFYMAYTLIALIVLHVSAALKHHFYDKDNILRRMISSS